MRRHRRRGVAVSAEPHFLHRAHSRILRRRERGRDRTRTRAEGAAVGEGRRGRLRRHDRRAASHGITLRDQARRLRQRSVQADRHRIDEVRVQRAPALAQTAPHRHRRARSGAARSRGRKDPRRSVGRQARHPSGLQRLFAIRRRDGRDCLRELRHSRRLRDARQTRDQRERANRARPIRRQLARDQTESRGRARRHRLHHLFGSARRRLLPGRGLSRRAVPRVGHDPARERHGHAALSRRSIHAGSTLEARCRADPDGQDRNVRADSGAADVVSRRRRAAEAV